MTKTPIGLLLAAGKGTRMGQTKQLIKLPTDDGRTDPLVALAFDTIAWTCQEMVVVVDADKDRVIDALGQRAFHVAEAHQTQQMSESVCVGLRWIHRQWPESPVLLQLADHPRVNQATVRQLLAKSKELPRSTILPSTGGRGGHPIVIPPSVIRIVLAQDPLGPLDEFWRTHPELCTRCKVDDDSVTCDLDNPEELADEIDRRKTVG